MDRCQWLEPFSEANLTRKRPPNPKWATDSTTSSIRITWLCSVINRVAQIDCGGLFAIVDVHSRGITMAKN